MISSLFSFMLKTMTLEILGSGTSTGVPVPSCGCAVCHSSDPADSRMRACALLRDKEAGVSLLIDAGPEFRLQALRAGITRIDAVLVTHSHADHIHGLDDLRTFCMETPLKIFSDAFCLKDIENRFDYAFKETQLGGGKPKFNLNPVTHGKTEVVAGVPVVPLRLLHGKLTITGWRFGDTAYLTDCSEIPRESVLLLEGIKNLVIDGLRRKAHPTHFNFERAAEAAFATSAEHIWLTHIGHECAHREITEWCSERAQQERAKTGRTVTFAPAYDGLTIPVSVPPLKTA